MSDQFTLGQHESKIEQLASDMSEVKAAVNRIELALAEKKGERRIGVWALTTVASGIGAAFTLVVKWVFKA